MSNLTTKTEYGTRKPSSVFVNVPYMIKGIGMYCDRLTKMHSYQMAISCSNPLYRPSDGTIEQMKYYLNNIKGKKRTVDDYLHRYNVDIYRYSRCEYFQFFKNYLDEFIDDFDEYLKNVS